VEPLVSTSSADIFTPHSANSYLEMPPAMAELPAGTEVRFWWIPGTQWSTL
jgi:hypothetical protein